MTETAFVQGVDVHGTALLGTFNSHMCSEQEEGQMQLGDLKA